MKVLLQECGLKPGHVYEIKAFMGQGRAQSQTNRNNSNFTSQRSIVSHKSSDPPVMTSSLASSQDEICIMQTPVDANTSDVRPEVRDERCDATEMSARAQEDQNDNIERSHDITSSSAEDRQNTESHDRTVAADAKRDANVGTEERSDVREVPVTSQMHLRERAYQNKPPARGHSRGTPRPFIMTPRNVRGGSASRGQQQHEWQNKSNAPPRFAEQKRRQRQLLEDSITPQFVLKQLSREEQTTSSMRAHEDWDGIDTTSYQIPESSQHRHPDPRASRSWVDDRSERVPRPGDNLVSHRPQQRFHDSRSYHNDTHSPPTYRPNARANSHSFRSRYNRNNFPPRGRGAPRHQHSPDQQTHARARSRDYQCDPDEFPTPFEATRKPGESYTDIAQDAIPPQVASDVRATTSRPAMFERHLVKLKRGNSHM